MLWYIAIIAALNLCLGYLWAVWTREGAHAFDAHYGFGSPPTTGQPRAHGLDAAPTQSPAASIEASAAAVSSAPLDSATGLVTREHAEQMLAHLAQEIDSGALTVALVEVDSNAAEGAPNDPAVDQRLLCGVSNVVRQSLAADHTAARYASEQLLLLVPHENVEHATRRAEELRQRVANTEFVFDGKSIKTTVTCALVESAPERSREQLLDFLQEALAEAKRYGGNRTFTHDGNSPAPVVPADLELAPQQLAI